MSACLPECRLLVLWINSSLDCLPPIYCRLELSFWQCMVSYSFTTLVLLATKWVWEFSVAWYLFWYSKVKFLASECLILLFMAYVFRFRLASIEENRHLSLIVLRASEVLNTEMEKVKEKQCFFLLSLLQNGRRGRVNNLGTQVLYWGPDSVIYSMLQFTVVSPEDHQCNPINRSSGILEETRVLTTISVLSSLYSIIASNAHFKSYFQW